MRLNDDRQTEQAELESAVAPQSKVWCSWRWGTRGLGGKPRHVKRDVYFSNGAGLARTSASALSLIHEQSRKRRGYIYTNNGMISAEWPVWKNSKRNFQSRDVLAPLGGEEAAGDASDVEWRNASASGASNDDERRAKRHPMKVSMLMTQEGGALAAR